jgi:Zn-dependent protease with chaperone function
MRLLVWSIALSIVLLIAFAEVVSIVLPPPPHEEALSLPIHKTFYIDRNVYDQEMLHIIEAALEWNEATNGQVIFDVKRMPRPNISATDSVIFFNVSPDFPDIILLDNARKKPLTTLAYYNGGRILPYIAVVDERISEKDYTGVMLHEMGHYLGLQHPDDEDHPEIGIGSLMHSTIDEGSGHITTEDLKQFCRIYHCDWKKFHGVPEVQ